MSTPRNCFPTYELEEVARAYGEGSTQVLALDALSLTIEQGSSSPSSARRARKRRRCFNSSGPWDRPSAGSVRFESQPLERLGDRALAELRLRAIGFVLSCPSARKAEAAAATFSPIWA